MNMFTKRGRVGTYNEDLPIIELHDPLIMWFCEVTLDRLNTFHLHLH